MPKLKSSKKRLRINRKAQLRNRAIRSRMRTAIKAVEQAEDVDAARAAVVGPPRTVGGYIYKLVLYGI